MADAAPEHTPTLDEDKVQPDLSKVSASGTPVKDTTAKVIVEKSDETPDEEETSGTSDEKETEPQEDGEEKPIIKLETAPTDFRFPTTNQTRHCFTRYIEYHRCIPVKGEGAPECEKFAKYYRSLCPSEWIERWNEQRQNGTFPGPL